MLYESVKQLRWIYIKCKSDVEISVGSEHAGYPMMCSGIDGCSYVWDLTDKTGKGINSGKAWGVFHEIGHMLHERRWTPTALREVTNNIMAEYVNEKLFNSKPAASSTAMTGLWSDCLRSALP